MFAKDGAVWILLQNAARYEICHTFPQQSQGRQH